METGMKRIFSFLVLLILVGSWCVAQQAPVEVLLSKARAMEGRGRLDLAAQSWQQVLMADPNQAEALSGLARFATQSGNAELAKTYTDRLRRIDPNHPAINQVEAT